MVAAFAFGDNPVLDVFGVGGQRMSAGGQRFWAEAGDSAFYLSHRRLVADEWSRVSPALARTSPS